MCNVNYLLYFNFYKPIYFMKDYSEFPSKSKEEWGGFIGILENLGHIINFNVLMDATNKIICQSNIFPDNDTLKVNICLDPINSSNMAKYKCEII